MRSFGCVNAASVERAASNPPIGKIDLPDVGPSTVITSVTRGGIRWARVSNAPVAGPWLVDEFGGVWVVT